MGGSKHGFGLDRHTRVQVSKKSTSCLRACSPAARECLQGKEAEGQLAQGAGRCVAGSCHAPVDVSIEVKPH